MVEVDYMHICDYAFPAQGGKACIIGIFDRIHATSFPTVHPQMSVAILPWPNMTVGRRQSGR